METKQKEIGKVAGEYAGEVVDNIRVAELEEIKDLKTQILYLVAEDTLRANDSLIDKNIFVADLIELFVKFGSKKEKIEDQLAELEQEITERIE
jgi:hypothetical protein